MNFEASYARLEKIVETISGQTLDLDEALRLYEEAEKLIQTCQKQLNEAEHKIEVLVKSREGELLTNESGKPQMEPFLAATTK